MMRSRNDLTIYDRLGATWWEHESPAFRSLRSVQQFRLGKILDLLGERVRGARVADLGCGGGLLAVPLAERGATVFGVDISAPSLRSARAELTRQQGSGTFVRGDLGAVPLAAGSFDLVLLADVLEHVEERRPLLREAARLLAAGGFVFASTINRTLRSRFLAITVAEGLRLVPPGTHDHRLFVTPRELCVFADAAGLECTALHGERVLLGATLRSRRIRLAAADSTAVGYSAVLQPCRT